MTGKLAWKNIGRNRTRSVIFISAATFGMTIAICAINLMHSISSQRLEDAISIQTGHLQIHTKGFTTNKEVTLFIQQKAKMQIALKSIRNSNSISERMVTTGMIASAENSVVSEIKGIYPKKERELSVLENYLIDGKWFDKQIAKPAIISEYLAKKLNLKIHSKFVVTVKNASSELEGAAFRVSGIFKTPNPAFDENTILVHYLDLSELLKTSSPHEIAIKLSDQDQLQIVQKKLQSQLGSQYEVSEWKDLLPELYAFSGFTAMVSMLFSIIILLGLGFGLLNTMNMIVQERSREIGMLRAIGQQRSALFGMLMKEAGLMMLIGSVLGVTLGVIVLLILSNTGINLGNGFGTLGIRTTIFPRIYIGQIGTMLIMATILTTIIAAIPAYKAFTIDPTSALKE